MLLHYLLHETAPCLDGIGVRSFVSGLCSAQCVRWQFHCSENIVKCVYTYRDHRDITRRWITVEYHHLGALPLTETMWNRARLYNSIRRKSCQCDNVPGILKQCNMTWGITGVDVFHCSPLAKKELVLGCYQCLLYSWRKLRWCWSLRETMA